MRQGHTIKDVRTYVTVIEMTPGLGRKIAASILKEHGDGARDVTDLHPSRYAVVVNALFKVMRDHEDWLTSQDEISANRVSGALPRIPGRQH